MATVKKKELLIEYELEFLEEKLKELKEYIQSNPYSSLTDRMAWKETKNGGAIPICIANKEAQRWPRTSALKVHYLLYENEIRAQNEVRNQIAT